MRTRFDFRVRGYELDSFGHVNNAVYLHYLEEARWNMFCENPQCRSYIIENGLFPAVIETKIKYISELKAFSYAYVLTDWNYDGNYIIAKHKIYHSESDYIASKATVKMLLLSKERIIYDLNDSLKELLSK